MLITSAGFFGFMFFKDNMSDAVVALTGTTPLAIAVFFGSAQNCLSKAAKYSFFDTTKEMAFIPLGHESKLKGKAAIDGVGSRIGKSGGSLSIRSSHAVGKLCSQRTLCGHHLDGRHRFLFCSLSCAGSSVRMILVDPIVLPSSLLSKSQNRKLPQLWYKSLRSFFC